MGWLKKWLRRRRCGMAEPTTPVMARMEYLRTGELHGYTTGEDA